MTVKIGDIEFDVAEGIWPLITFTLLGLFVYYLRNPEKFEKLVALIYKYLRYIYKKAEYGYVKYDIQSSLNDYIARVNRNTQELAAVKAKVEWVDSNINAETFISNGQAVIRMQKSDNQNRNLVNAAMGFISESFLKKAKSYVSKTQRESLDLFVCYDLLRIERAEILNQFVEDFLKGGLDNGKVAEFFDKYVDIQAVGVFYPILIQELKFLGEKVFARKREANKIFAEVTGLVNFLYRYANRKISEDIVSEFTGSYCKFAIRIVGRKFKVENHGTRVYVNNIEKIAPSVETIYLISPSDRGKFTREVFAACRDSIGYKCIAHKSYRAVIKDAEGNNKKVDNYLMVLRNERINVYHRL